MIRLRALVFAALAFGALGVQAGNANATQGWYGRIDAGYSVDGELDAGSYGSYDLENDLMASSGVGYAFTNGVRVEGELSFRTNDLSGSSDANVDATALMANIYYDFNRGGRVQPYIGAGAGVAKLKVTDLDSDERFAYQALAGVGIGLTEQLTLDLGYRYFAVRNADLGEVGNACEPPPVEQEVFLEKVAYVALPQAQTSCGVSRVDGDYTHQALTIGLRYQFAAPAAPAPVPVSTPAPVAVCPQSDFVVYFEWDRSTLNAQALEVIDSAAARMHECNVSAALIIGHTDTSGSTAYNAGLSERRATVVQDALVARGLATSLITTQAKGETELARATADGVREPLNRRTAVTISFQ